jgi:hypothetical protein
MMMGSADTARYTCGATGPPCILLTRSIYQVPGCVPGAWQAEEAFAHRQVRGSVPCLGARNPAGPSVGVPDADYGFQAP